MGFLDLLSLPFRKWRLFLPFLGVYILKWFFWCGFLFYCVQWPLKIVFGPIIVRFWGEFFVHYPGHIFWMFRVLKSSDWVFNVFFASIASFILIRLTWNYLSGEKMRFSLLAFLIYIIINFILFFLGTFAIANTFLSHITSRWLAIIVIFGLNVFLQVFFVYNLLSIAVFGRLVSFFWGWRVLLKKWLATTLLIAIILAIFLLFVLLEPKFLAIDAVKVYPELGLAYLAGVDFLAILFNTILHVVLTGWFYREEG